MQLWLFLLQTNVAFSGLRQSVIMNQNMDKTFVNRNPIPACLHLAWLPVCFYSILNPFTKVLRSPVECETPEPFWAV